MTTDSLSWTDDDFVWCRGEHLTTMLVDSMGSTLYRQILLLKRRNSYCFCERCRHPTELETHSGTLRCLEDDSWILPIDTSHIFTTDWKCIGKCQTVYSNSCIFHTMHDMEGDMNILDVSDAVSLTTRSSYGPLRIKHNDFPLPFFLEKRSARLRTAALYNIVFCPPESLFMPVGEEAINTIV